MVVMEVQNIKPLLKREQLIEFPTLWLRVSTDYFLATFFNLGRLIFRNFFWTKIIGDTWQNLAGEFGDFEAIVTGGLVNRRNIRLGTHLYIELHFKEQSFIEIVFFLIMRNKEFDA